MQSSVFLNYSILHTDQECYEGSPLQSRDNVESELCSWEQKHWIGRFLFRALRSLA